MVNYDLLSVQYFENELPCPYKTAKKTEIKIYPILVSDYITYMSCRGIMEIDKNATGDIETIQMSYLGFLINKVFTEENDLELNRFITFIRLILHEEYINVVELEKRYYLVILEKSEIDGFITKHIISSKELEEISKIAFFQNDPDYDDTIYDADVKKAIDDYYKLKYKGNSPSLEKQKAYLISKTGFNVQYINNMIYRTFNLVYKACVDSELYISQQLMRCSSNFMIKEPVIHPLFEAKKNKLNEVFSLSVEDLERKIQT